MGNAGNRKYIRNFAKTLMGQLKVDMQHSGGGGIANYRYDLIAANIRKTLVERVFVDLRHCKGATVARLATCGIMGTSRGQQESPSYEKLQQGLEPCTMCFVHHWDADWIGEKENEGPEAIIRYMAATAIVAAMYDIVVQKKVAS